MTPRYPRLVSLLRAVDARQWIDVEALEYLGTLVTWINVTGDGPSVNGRALVLTESGRDVLELATWHEVSKLETRWLLLALRRKQAEEYREELRATGLNPEAFSLACKSLESIEREEKEAGAAYVLAAERAVQ